jgi:L-fucose isomerase-like protein
MREITLGVIIGNRNFFADELCKTAREELLPVLQEAGIKAVILPETEGVYGSVESRADSKNCADLFKKHQDEIKGVIVSLPNFGDEKAIAETLRLSGLEVPILVHAFPDEVNKLTYENRRDSFCGKISVCNNLRQYKIKFSLTERHNIAVNTEEFKKDLSKFIGVCKVVDKMRGARVGVIGPRPADFNTVRYSEKILEYNNISVEPIGLIDIIKGIEDSEESIIENRRRIESYITTTGVPEKALDKMAQFLGGVEKWIEENELDAVAIQCWDALQKYFGINPCTVMSMLSNNRIPAACEADVLGALSMLALQEASDKPSALVDWNNNFQDEVDKFIVFHCGNFARDIYDNCKVSYAEILGSTLGKENTYGAIYGRIKPGNITFARLTTDDTTGKIKGILAEGTVMDEDLKVNGSWGAIEIPGLQKLLQQICLNGFEHHVAINLSLVSGILEEAFTKYLGWDVYRHE